MAALQHRTIKVQAIPGERFCYWVESWSDPLHPNRVDIVAHLGRSQCSCKSWQTRCWPIIRDKLPEFRFEQDGSSICRHVEAARLVFLRDLLHRLALEEHNPAEL